MKWHLMARARPDAGSYVPKLHAQLGKTLAKVPPPWPKFRAAWPAAEEPDSFLEQVPLTKVLGLRSNLTYDNRWGLEDDAQHDDWLKVEFNPEKAFDYPLFVRKCVKSLIAALGAYTLTIRDEEFVHRYFTQWQKTGYDGRDGVFMLSPVHYMDATLCGRAFGLSAEQVVERVAPAAESASVFRGGALLVLSSEPLPFKVADTLVKKARKLLPAGPAYRRKPWKPPPARERHRTFAEHLAAISPALLKRLGPLDPKLAGLVLDYSEATTRPAQKFLWSLRSNRARLTDRQWGELLRWWNAFWAEYVERSVYAEHGRPRARS